MKSLPAGADNHHLVQPNPGWDSGVINGVICTIITESLFFFFPHRDSCKILLSFCFFQEKIILPLAPSYGSSVTNFGEILHMGKHSGPDPLEK